MRRSLFYERNAPNKRSIVHLSSAVLGRILIREVLSASVHET